MRISTMLEGRSAELTLESKALWRRMVRAVTYLLSGRSLGNCCLDYEWINKLVNCASTIQITLVVDVRQIALN